MDCIKHLNSFKSIGNKKQTKNGKFFYHFVVVSLNFLNLFNHLIYILTYSEQKFKLKCIDQQWTIEPMPFRHKPLNHAIQPLTIEPCNSVINHWTMQFRWTDELMNYWTIEPMQFRNSARFHWTMQFSNQLMKYWTLSIQQFSNVLLNQAIQQ